jgi:hypothetical protein
MAKKSKVDVEKGFKRIFYVVAAVWFVFIRVLTAAERSECIGDPSIMPLSVMTLLTLVRFRIHY